jgi:hypothetical protein
MRDNLVQRGHAFREAFQLASLDSILRSRQWLKNFYVLDLLEKTLKPHFPAALHEKQKASSPLRVLDVGTADWEYVFALHRFCRHALIKAGIVQPMVDEPQFILTGVEIDGHGIYPDGYARADYTAAYIDALQDPGITIQYGDATQMEMPLQDLVTCFFPFILPYQILAWGLPLRLLHPKALLSRQATWRPLVFGGPCQRRKAAHARAIGNLCSIRTTRRRSGAQRI